MQFKNIATAAAILGLASAQSLSEVLEANAASLSTLSTLLQDQPEIVEALTAAENITILAPSNAAFEKFLAANPGAADQADVVAALLQYHVLGALVPSTGFSETPAYVATLLTDPMYTNVTGGQVVEGVVKDGGVSVFSGGRAESKVETPDVTFDGGVVHVIDTVLTIPGSIADAATAANLTSLAEAVVATDLLSTVESIEDITLFAPTNEAFAAIAEVAAGLTTEELAAILTYHVVSGAVAYSGELESGEVPTVNGANVNVEVSDAGVKINDANVVVADVLVANGVVHVIDAVLIPEAADNTATTTTGGPAPTGTDGTPTSTFTGAATRPTMIGAAVLAAAGMVAGLL